MYLLVSLLSVSLREEQPAFEEELLHSLHSYRDSPYWAQSRGEVCREEMGMLVK